MGQLRQDFKLVHSTLESMTQTSAKMTASMEALLAAMGDQDARIDELEQRVARLERGK